MEGKTLQLNAMGNMDKKKLTVILAQPRGFCAGVKRAIKIVETAIEKYGAPVWVLHEIVHNTHVIKNLSEAGAIFVEDINEIPTGAITIFSAHGVATSVEEKAAQKSLKVIDATCPLVKKVHYQAQKYNKMGHDIVIIGHHGHPEVEGTLGRVDGNVTVVSTIEDVKKLKVANPEKVAYVTQTTLSTDDTRELIKELERRFPNIKGPNLSDICYATQSRQDAVRKLAEEVDMLLVVGSQNSSNSNRLRETGTARGLPAYLVDNADHVNLKWFENKSVVGITAGASAPEILVQNIIDMLQEHFCLDVRPQNGKKETMQFKLPKFPDYN